MTKGVSLAPQPSTNRTNCFHAFVIFEMNKKKSAANTKVKIQVNTITQTKCVYKSRVNFSRAVEWAWPRHCWQTAAWWRSSSGRGRVSVEREAGAWHSNVSPSSKPRLSSWRLCREKMSSKLNSLYKSGFPQKLILNSWSSLHVYTIHTVHRGNWWRPYISRHVQQKLSPWQAGRQKKLWQAAVEVEHGE